MKFKNLKFFVILYFILIPFTRAVTPDMNEVKGNGLMENVSAANICNIGETNGVLYPNQWFFRVKALCSTPEDYSIHTGKCKKTDSIAAPIVVEVDHREVKICKSSGCSGDEFDISFYAGVGLLTEHDNYINLFSSDTKGVAGVYNDESLEKLLLSRKCPKYIYVGSSKKKKKIAFIFSSQEVKNPTKYFEDKGYTVSFEEQSGGENLNVVNDKNYKDILKKMKDNIKKFKDEKWDTIYSEECSKFNNFGAIAIDENVTLEYYEKYKKEIQNSGASYDFSEGDKVYKDYKKNYKCAPKPKNNELEPLKLNNLTCSTLFKNTNGEYNDTHKLLTITLKFLQYLAIIMAIVLSILDFFMVVPTQDKDALKKCTVKAAMRIGIALLIFFVPIILKFVLQLIGIENPFCDIL